MTPFNEKEEGDNWVTYGSAFSDDESEDSRFRALQFGKPRAIPSAFEQRMLNEKGRPMRFHGAFTGGFSAGYFNTVGSKEGFVPKSFTSSRKTRQRAPEDMVTQHPEDFMDDEDFGEFGIAPRRIKLSSTFDDSHLRDTLKAAIGGQSVIPGAGSIIKNLIVPSKGPLAQRLLRKMGWRESQLELADDAVEHEPSPLTSTFDAPELTVPVVYYTKIDFEGKNNTFGLGYSGLDPNIAMGRRQFVSDKSFRHPEESSSALVERQSSLQRGFVPLEGPARTGIRGQAFGVGVLELDDPDVYDTDRLADYDWEIGGNATDEEASDDEESELEAARLGRWSGSDKQKGKSVGHKTLDGWTAPSRRTASHPSDDASKRSTFPGFIVGSVLTGADSYAGNSEPVRIPPGYIPVFNPKCVRDPNSSEDPSVELSAQLPARRTFDRKSDVLFRSQTLEQTMKGSVFDLLSPIGQLHMKAAAAGLPVPNLTVSSAETAQVPPSSTLPPMRTDALLKPFKFDPAKQARFEAFQVLIRRGFSSDEAYTRSSGDVDMPSEDREREVSSFNAILRASHLPVSSAERHHKPNNVSDAEDRERPIANLPDHKLRLVADLLSSRFRSAGCMDISKELSEAEEKALRAKVESLETLEPRDHAVATESYGALTRRRLVWHPDRILCKRINVPHPYPDSTFVGCPDERRPRNPFRRRRARHPRGESGSRDFSLFDLLDINRGREEEDSDSSRSSVTDQCRSPANRSSAGVSLLDTNPASPVAPDAPVVRPLPTVSNPSSRGAALFACLFESADANPSAPEVSPTLPREMDAAAQSLDSTINRKPRQIGPLLPPSVDNSIANEPDDKPPSMDLFKSIFASDEELSSSDAELDVATSTASTIENRTVPRPDFENRANGWSLFDPPGNSTSNDRASSLIAHLFEPTGDAGAPLSALSQLTTKRHPRPLSDQRHQPHSSPDPALLYGPALPPILNEYESSTSLLQQTTILEQVIGTVSADEVHWTDSRLVKKNEKRKHKHGKHKHLDKHKHSSKRRRNH